MTHQILSNILSSVLSSFNTFISSLLHFGILAASSRRSQNTTAHILTTRLVRDDEYVHMMIQLECMIVHTHSSGLIGKQRYPHDKMVVEVHWNAQDSNSEISNVEHFNVSDDSTDETNQATEGEECYSSFLGLVKATFAHCFEVSTELNDEFFARRFPGRVVDGLSIIFYNLRTKEGDL